MGGGLGGQWKWAKELKVEGKGGGRTEVGDILLGISAEYSDDDGKRPLQGVLYVEA